MSFHPSLKHALTELYLGNMAFSAGEVTELLQSIDFVALEDAVNDRMEPVFAYTSDSRLLRRFNVRTGELFDLYATLLCSGPHVICDLDGTGAVVCSKGLELWLLEDMTFAVVAHYGIYCLHNSFYAHYRAVKNGSPWKCGMKIDLRMLTEHLKSMYAPDNHALSHDVEDETESHKKDGSPFGSEYIFPYDDLDLPIDEYDMSV